MDDFSFARLEAISAQLNTVSDSVSELLKRVEAKLATLRLGVEVWLDEPIGSMPIGDKGGQPSDGVTFHVGYAKVNGTWQLAVKCVHLDLRDCEIEEMKPYVPLHEAPRD